MMDITITINNAEVTASVEPRTTLADFLRDQRRMTSIHLGCENGVCGDCTIIADGAPGPLSRRLQGWYLDYCAGLRARA